MRVLEALAAVNHFDAKKRTKTLPAAQASAPHA